MVKIQSVEPINPVYMALVLTYLRLSNHQLGLSVDFKVPLLKDGVNRLVNKLSPKKPLRAMCLRRGLCFKNV